MSLNEKTTKEAVKTISKKEASKPVQEVKHEAPATDAAVKAEVKELKEAAPAATKKTQAKTAQAKKAAESVKPAQKKEPASVKSTTAKKTAAKKTAEPETPAKKTAEKSQNPVIKIYIQSAGKEVEHNEIIDRVKEDWAAKGNNIKNIKTLDTYIKPEEDAIYYVINDIPNSGKIAF